MKRIGVPLLSLLLTFSLILPPSLFADEKTSIRPNPADFKSGANLSFEGQRLFKEVIQKSGRVPLRVFMERDSKESGLWTGAHAEKEAILKSIEQRIKGEAFHATVDSLRTVLLILTITGVAVVQQKIKAEHLSGEASDPTFTAEICVEVAKHLVNSGGLWFGIAGGGISGLLFHKPIQIIQALLEHTVSRSLFISLLGSMIQSAIVFVGWEFSAQLWEEARLLLDSNDDYERSAWIFGFSSGALLSLASDRPEYRRDRDLFLKLLNNLGMILFYDSDLRTAWLYNSFRLRLATGDFVTLISCMIGAGLVGSALFPGAGTIAGAAFGLVGGIAAIQIPQTFKDAITLTFKGDRGSWNQMMLFRNNIAFAIDDALEKRETTALLFTLGKIANLLMRKSKDTIDDPILRTLVVEPIDGYLRSIDGYLRSCYDHLRHRKGRHSLSERLEERHTVRENILTVLFETYYLLRVRKQQAQDELMLAEQRLKAEEKPDGFSQFFWNHVAFEAEQFAKSDLAKSFPFFYAIFTRQKPLDQMAAENRLLIETATKLLEIVEAGLNLFYVDEIQFLKSELATRRLSKPTDAALLESELKNIGFLESHVRQLLKGLEEIPVSEKRENLFSERLTMERLCIAALVKINTYGFDEQEIVDRWLKAIEELNEGKPEKLPPNATITDSSILRKIRKNR